MDCCCTQYLILKGWHYGFTKQPHGAQDLSLFHIPKPKATVEVVDTHGVLHGLNALDASVWRANDQKAVQEILNAGFVLKRNRNGMAMFHPFAIVAQAQGDAHIPTGLLNCFAGVSLAIGNIDGPLRADVNGVIGFVFIEQAVKRLTEFAQPVDGDPIAAGEQIEAARYRRFNRFRALA